MEINPLVVVAIMILVAYTFFYTPGGQLRNLLVLFVLFIIGVTLVLAVSEMPLFGSVESPAYNYVVQRYITGTVPETGALNAIAAIITDYRAFDTLGEATVLFTAVAAALATLGAQQGKR
ncbi:MAG: hydrogen gas-evolving membrane-bound hydrogenase subunit E [Bacillota bacterium]